MIINEKIDGSSFTYEIEGRLDTVTSPALEAKLGEAYPKATELILDFKGLDYISSAGLRVLLASQKVMNKQGKMILKNVKEAVMEVFEITGFLDILTIEK